MFTRLLHAQIVDGLRDVRWLIILAVSVLLLVIQQQSSFPSVWVLPDIGPTFLNYMLLFNYYGSGTHLYLFLMAFLASLAGGSVYSKEKHGGRLQLDMARIPRGQIARSSMVAGFLLGGFGGLFPLMLSMVVAIVREPHMQFVDGHFSDDAYPVISFDSWVYGFYECNQVMLLIATLLYVFVLAGLLSCLAICVSFWSKYRYVELIVPFMLSYAVWIATNGTSLAGLSFIDFLSLRVARESCCALGAIATLPVLALLTIIGYVSQVQHETC